MTGDALTEERRAALLDYCKLAAAEGYLAQAGVSLPAAGTPRQAQYDLCVNYLVLNFWDNRDTSYTGAVTVDNPAFRQMVNQLKLTEGV